jgi:hypothetical protein
VIAHQLAACNAPDICGLWPMWTIDHIKRHVLSCVQCLVLAHCRLKPAVVNKHIRTLITIGSTTCGDKAVSMYIREPFATSRRFAHGDWIDGILLMVGGVACC